MLRNRSHRRPDQRGFTFVEIVIIAPIVILTIGAFITTIVGMTGEVLASRAANVQAYNVQDALNRIENDVKLSTGFLATSNVALTNASPAFTSVQGVSDDTNPFENVGGTNGPALILNTLATSGNPISTSSSLVYLVNNPNACASSQVSQNVPLTLNVVYYVKNSTLWRRTILPYNYTTAGCVVPWQQPSCTPGYVSSFCKTQDIQLVDGIGTGGFAVQYFNLANAKIENSGASSGTDAARAAAILTSPTVGISITSNKTVAGRSIIQAATLRATRLDTNASTIAPVVAPTTPVAPVLSASLSVPNQVIFNWPTVAGATGYTFQYQINGTGGTWQTGFTNNNTTTYTVSANQSNVVYGRATATNLAGTSGYSSNVSLTIPLWSPLIMQNNWTDYQGTYATAAYTKTSDGLVVLKGMIQGGTQTAGTLLATLPVGYRPAAVMMFSTQTNSNVASRVDVYPDGTIIFQVGSNGWLSLDGIKFEPTTSPYTFTAMTFSNSWVNYGSIYQTAGYTIDGMGRVQIQGLIKNGSTTTSTVISSLTSPSTTYLPSLYQHLQVAANNTMGFISTAQTNSTYPGAGIQYKGGGNGYLSLNNMYYSAALSNGGACTAAIGQWCNLVMAGGWGWYSSTGIFATPQYTKAADGVVTLKGLISAGTATAGTVMATLPSGYRPAERLLTQVVSNSAIGRVDILTDGTVVIEAGSNAWLALDSINFVADGS